MALEPSPVVCMIMGGECILASVGATQTLSFKCSSFEPELQGEPRTLYAMQYGVSASIHRYAKKNTLSHWLCIDLHIMLFCFRACHILFACNTNSCLFTLTIFSLTCCIPHTILSYRVGQSITGIGAAAIPIYYLYSQCKFTTVYTATLYIVV